MFDYAANVLRYNASFIDFAIDMCDRYGEDGAVLCKAIYTCCKESPDSFPDVQFSSYEEVHSYSVEDIKRNYAAWKARQTTLQRYDLFKENVDELQFLVQERRKTKEFKRMLHYVSRFPHLAPYNAMLIQMQRPGAQLVLSGRGWRRYNRRPKPNATPLITLFPFGPILAMFDISDTEQIPGEEEMPKYKILEQWDGMLMKTQGTVDEKRLQHLLDNLKSYGIFLDCSLRAANTYGGYIEKYDKRCLLFQNKDGDTFFEYPSKFIITVNAEASATKKFLILCHELGHLFCKHIWYETKKERHELMTTKEMEFEAETVAWLVGKRMGLYGHSDNYLAGYSTDGIVPICSLDLIMHAVSEIERMTEQIIDVKKCAWYKEDKNFREAYDSHRGKKEKHIRY